jgi:DNA-binding transcriptional LysR family regulator
LDKLAAWRAFAAVVEQNGFSAAASTLGLTASAVTKTVAQLEQQLGVRLLARSTRQLSLTGEGQIFFERCRRILVEIEMAELEMGQTSTAPRGLLHVQVPVVIGRLHVIPRLRALLEAYPEITLRVTQADRRLDMIKHGIDLAIWTGELPESRLVARLLARSYRITCAAPAYIERYGRPGTPDDLADHNCLRTTSWQSGRTWLFRMPGGERTIGITGNLLLDNSDSYREAALAGLGIAQGTSFLFRDDVASGALVQLLPDYVAEGQKFWAVYPDIHSRSPKVGVLVDLLDQTFQPFR